MMQQSAPSRRIITCTSLARSPLHTPRPILQCPSPTACLTTERNLPSAIVNIGVVVVLCVAMFQPRWFWMEGGGCSTHTLSLYLFFFAGQFVEINDISSASTSSTSSTNSDSSDATTPYIYYINGQELRMCITPHIVTLLQVVIGLVFLMACCAVVQIMLDVAGPAGKAVRCLRRNALPSILAVWVCVAGVGVCHRLTTLLETLQDATKGSDGGLLALERVQVKFDVGFYFLILAGGLSVLSVGCSWLRPAHIFQLPDQTPLIEDCGLEGLEALSGPGCSPHYPHLMDLEPPPPLEGTPPPPYTP